MSLQAPTSDIRRLLKSAGRTTPVTIIIEGESGESLSFIRDVAVNPVTGEIQHIDFLRIQADRKIQVPVVVNLVGEAPVTRGGEAQIDQMAQTINVLAFPLKVPSVLEADLSNLREIGDVIRVGELEFPEDVEPASNPDDVVVRAQRQRAAEIFEVVGGEAAEGEEVAEDEEALEAEEAAADGEASADARAGDTAEEEA